MPHRLTPIAAALLIAATALAAGPAGAEPRGLLDCSPAERPGLLFGAGDAVDCRWLAPNGTARSFHGMVKTGGTDLNATPHAAFAWSVDVAGTAALDGDYSPAATAKRLVGGENDAVTLVPANIMSQTSVNLAGSVTSLKLKAK